MATRPARCAALLAMAGVAAAAPAGVRASSPLEAVAIARGEPDAVVRRLQEATYRWTQEHHDTRNSGNSGWIGPAEAPGVCRHTVSRRAPDSCGSGALPARAARRGAPRAPPARPAVLAGPG